MPAEHLIQAAIALSERLSLDERTCVRLMIRAYNSPRLRASTWIKTVDRVEKQYFSEREFLLSILLDLFKGRMDEEVSLELKSLLTKFSNEIIPDVAPVCLKRLQLLMQLPFSPNTEEWNHYLAERHRLCELVFFIYFQSQITAEHALQLSRVVREYAVEHATKSQREKDPALLQCLTLLLCALIASWDTSVHFVDPKDAQIKTNQLATDSAFQQRLEQELEADGHQPDVQGVLLFAFTIFLQGHDSQQAAAVLLRSYERDPFTFMSYCVQALEGCEEDILALVCISFDRLLIQYLNRRGLWQALKRRIELDAEQSQMSKHGQLSSAIPATTPSGRPLLASLCLLVAALCKAYPALAIKYWGGQDRATMDAGLLSTSTVAAAETSRAAQTFRIQAGDRIKAEYYAEYLEMLAALARGPGCAKAAFEFLTTGVNRVLTLDHFFRSLRQTIQNLTSPPVQEPSQFGEGIYLQQAAQPTGLAKWSHSDLHPADLARMRAVESMMNVMLSLLQDEALRFVLLQSHEWQLLDLLFALLSCPVPCSLKAKTLHCVAALAESTQIYPQIWQRLEESQILTTIPQQSSSTQGQMQNVPGASPTPQGIKYELEFVESTDRHYPETIAFLQLLHTLLRQPRGGVQNSSCRNNLARSSSTDLGSNKHTRDLIGGTYTGASHFVSAVDVLPNVEEQLGYGYREPGILPYLQFVIDDVFLKFDQRGYEDISEKWQTAAWAMQIIVDVVSDYLYTDRDLDAANVAVSRPSGYLLLRLLSGSPLFAKVMSVCSQGVDMLEQAHDSKHYIPMLKSIQHSLLLLRVVLDKDEGFLQIARRSDVTAVCVSLPELLLRKHSHIIEIARYVFYEGPAVELPLLSVHLIGMLGLRSEALVPVLVSNGLQHVMIQAYARKLQQSADETDTDSQTLSCMSNPLSTPLFPLSLRASIIRLLLQNASRPAPSVTHMLLGFTLNRPLSDTDLTVSGASTACINALASLSLEQLQPRLVSQEQWKRLIRHHESTRESILQLFYSLVIQPLTSSALLKYLRHLEATSHFFEHQITREMISDEQTSVLKADTMRPQSKFVQHRTTEDSAVDEVVALRACELRQRAILLELLSIELHTNASAFMSKRTSSADETTAMEFVRHLVELLLSTDSSKQLAKLNPNVQQTQSLVVELLSYLSPHGMAVDPPTPSALFSRVDPHILQVAQLPLPGLGVGVPAQSTSAVGVILDLEVLNNGLTHLSHTARSATGVDPADSQLRQQILEAAISFNLRQQEWSAHNLCLNGWKKVMSVLWVECWTCIPSEDVVGAVYECIDSMLHYLATLSSVHALHLAETVVVLLNKLRELSSDSLPSSPIFAPSQLPAQSQINSGIPLSAAQCHRILQALLQILMRPGTTQHIRGHLYAAMLHYLEYCRTSSKRRAGLELPTVSPASSSARASSTIESAAAFARWSQDLYAGNRQLLERTGEKLVGLLARDSCEGMDGWRSAALCTLACLIQEGEDEYGGALAPPQRWLHVLVQHGHLAHILQDLAQQDDSLSELQSFASASPAGLQPLYVYEAVMALLLSLAYTEQGASTLLSSNIVSVLNNSKFLLLRNGANGNQDMEDYEAEDGMEGSSWLPSRVARSRQVFLPVLRLLTCLLTRLPKHQGLVNQVVELIDRHHKAFVFVMKKRAASLTSLSVLRELQSVAALLFSVAPYLFRASKETLSSSSTSAERPMFKRHKLLRYAALLLAELVESRSSQDDRLKDEKDQMRIDSSAEDKLQLQLTLATVCGYLIGCIRQATAVDVEHAYPFSPSFSTRVDNGDAMDDGMVPQTRTVLLGALSSCLGLHTGFLTVALERISVISKQFEKINDIRLQDVLGEEEFMSLTAPMRQQRAVEKLSRAFQKAQNISSVSFLVIENALWLLFNHLNHYLQQSGSKATSNWSSNRTDESSRASERLRAEAIGVLASLLTTLSELDHNKLREKSLFVQTFVRRIRELLSLPGYTH
eukprot:GILJ01008594.1.p1 GENE.GILJ01008594.1~~GILJ01008594.1.p1  ORF type:complete len:2053 (+),score=299.56 GILJ01008594.1:227-6160(+)